MKDGTIQRMERAEIERVLTELKGNITQAAKVLGIDRRTMYRKLNKYGLKACFPICPTCGAERG